MFSREKSGASCFDYFKGNGSKQAVLVFFHGFPGLVTKNEDCAKLLSEEDGFDCYLYHYTGLGVNNKGEFTFSVAFKEAESFIEGLSKDNDLSLIHI